MYMQKLIFKIYINQLGDHGEKINIEIKRNNPLILLPFTVDEMYFFEKRECVRKKRMNYYREIL